MDADAGLAVAWVVEPVARRPWCRPPPLWCVRGCLGPQHSPDNRRRSEVVAGFACQCMQEDRLPKCNVFACYCSHPLLSPPLCRARTNAPRQMFLHLGRWLGMHCVRVCMRSPGCGAEGAARSTAGPGRILLHTHHVLTSISRLLAQTGTTVPNATPGSTYGLWRVCALACLLQFSLQSDHPTAQPAAAAAAVSAWAGWVGGRRGALASVAAAPRESRCCERLLGGRLHPCTGTAAVLRPRRAACNAAQGRNCLLEGCSCCCVLSSLAAQALERQGGRVPGGRSITPHALWCKWPSLAHCVMWLLVKALLLADTLYEMVPSNEMQQLSAPAS